VPRRLSGWVVYGESNCVSSQMGKERSAWVVVCRIVLFEQTDQRRTTEVARFVPAAAPSSSLYDKLLSRMSSQAHHLQPLLSKWTGGDSLASHPHILHPLTFLGQKRHMAQDVHRRNIPGQDQQSLLALPQSLDDLFDTSTQLTGLGGFLGGFEDLFV
jgi:hypothetical protein